MEALIPKRRVVVLRGIPGAGKSTYADQLVSKHTGKTGGLHINPNNKRIIIDPRYKICSADQYFMVGDEYVYDATKIADAHRQCLQEFDVTIWGAGSTPLVIVDNTNISLWEMSPYGFLAHSRGYEVQIHSVVTDVHVAAERCIHGVPLDVIQKRNDAMEVVPPHWPVKRAVILGG